jgi:hypothetical protein
VILLFDFAGGNVYLLAADMGIWTLGVCVCVCVCVCIYFLFGKRKRKPHWHSPIGYTLMIPFGTGLFLVVIPFFGRVDPGGVNRSRGLVGGTERCIAC